MIISIREAFLFKKPKTSKFDWIIAKHQGEDFWSEEYIRITGGDKYDRKQPTINSTIDDGGYLTIMSKKNERPDIWNDAIVFYYNPSMDMLVMTNYENNSQEHIENLLRKISDAGLSITKHWEAEIDLNEL